MNISVTQSNQSASLCHVNGITVLGLLQRLCHRIASSVWILSIVVMSIGLSVPIPFCLAASLLNPASLVPLITLERLHLNSTLHCYPTAVCCSLKPRLLIGLVTSTKRLCSLLGFLAAAKSPESVKPSPILGITPSGSSISGDGGYISRRYFGGSFG